MATKEDLEAFVTSVTSPDDFDEFWSETLTALTREPLNPMVTPDPLRSNDDVNVYWATYRSLDGLEIFGWYSVPAAGEGPFPAILVLPGYKSEPALRRDWGRKGVAVLSVAVRGKLPSSARFNPGYPGLLTSGIESRDTYSYKGVISDCSRGVDFLLSRPEIDPERIYASGSSQGGGLTLATAGLRPEIKGGRLRLSLHLLLSRIHEDAALIPLRRALLLPARLPGAGGADAGDPALLRRGELRAAHQVPHGGGHCAG